jgi:hypothetical protein
MIRTAPPQAGQVSIPNARFRRCVKVISERYILVSAIGEFQNAESCGSAAC